jgi:hypothetical protein
MPESLARDQVLHSLTTRLPETPDIAVLYEKKMVHTHTNLSDNELIAEVKNAAGDERQATATLVALLAEVDARRLYLSEGVSSLFVFCTRALHMSEHAAYARIEAARLARRFPTIFERLSDGRLSLTAVGLLAPHLTSENGERLLDAATHLSKREVEHLIAPLYPQPDIPATIRQLPARPPALVSGSTPRFPTNAAGNSGASHSPAPAAPTVAAVPRRVTVAPLAPDRYLLRVTIGHETRLKLECARDLLRHQIPDGDPATIIDRALTLLVAGAERTKFAATSRRSRSWTVSPTDRRSRRIPAAIRSLALSRGGPGEGSGHRARCHPARARRRGYCSLGAAST